MGKPEVLTRQHNSQGSKMFAFQQKTMQFGTFLRDFTFGKENKARYKLLAIRCGQTIEKRWLFKKLPRFCGDSCMAKEFEKRFCQNSFLLALA